MSQPDIAVIDPGMGNLRSVCKAWEHAGASVRLCKEPSTVRSPDAVVFPGQGGMPHCMDSLKQTGFDAFIKDWISSDKPFFGICLGLQALFSHSEEGDTLALGVFPGQVVRFNLGHEHKIPHMGWNTVSFQGQPSSADAGLSRDKDHFYFVHSYHVQCENSSIIWGETDYGYRFVSAIRQGCCFATQFHPEKSQSKGLKLYSNFVKSL